MINKFLAKNKFKVTAILTAALLASAGLYLISQQGPDNQTSNQNDQPVENNSQDQVEPENPINGTEKTGEKVENYTNERESNQSGTNYSLSLLVPPEKGESTRIYFTIDGEGIENAPVYVDGEFVRDTQEGIPAGKTFVEVPENERFEVTVEVSGKNYSETFETVAE